jgi:predicted extracellular nuclease
MTENYFIAWWNLENLFDSVNADRPEWLQKKLKNELKGWTQTVLNKKLSNLARVINSMNDGHGPDILGVCEVENKPVLDKLVARLNPARNYQVAHHDTSDKRAIDVAYVFDANKFTATAQFDYVVQKRNATRDIFQVNFKTQHDNSLVCLGNHWPARSAGQYASEPYRIMAAETLSHWMSRIPAHTDENCAILVMGDFNDEPFNRSMREYALSTRNSKRVASKRSKKPYLYNCMWDLLADNRGTYHFGSWNMLDQFLVNKNFFGDSARFSFSGAKIFSPASIMKNSKPRRFGRPSGSSHDVGGYSDHYPITIEIQERSN